MRYLQVLSLFLVFRKFRLMCLHFSTFPLKTLSCLIDYIASNSVEFSSFFFMQKGGVAFVEASLLLWAVLMSGLMKPPLSLRVMRVWKGAKVSPGPMMNVVEVDSRGSHQGYYRRKGGHHPL